MTKEQIIKILKKYELSDDGDIIIYTTEINAFADAILALPIEGETDKEQADDKPGTIQFAMLSKEEKDHVNKGGLLMRKRTNAKPITRTVK